jgi:nickel-dependent lactate racemase
MSLNLPYGDEFKELRVPPDVVTDFLDASSGGRIDDIEAAFAAACREPVGVPPLDESVTTASNVIILVSDVTRSAGTETLLPLCVRYLEELGVPRAQMTVLIAKGTHRKLTREERDLLKTEDLAGVRIEEHDCDDTDKLSALLLTRRGTPVRTNSVLKDADVIVLLAPVSFHYFAGFGGGRKLVLPGAAERSSILANHRLSLVNSKPVTLHPRCRPGRTDGNPVHEDMCETVEALHGVFGINFFGGDNGLTFINAGDPVKAHARACAAYKKVYSVQVRDPYDVMILSAGGHPCDINFLQSHKALRHSCDGIKKGGTVLFYAKCEEGVGSESLEAALRLGKKEFLSAAYSKYQLNNQTAVSLHDLTERFEVGMVSAMNVDVLLSCGIKSYVNAEAFLADALDKHETKRIAVVTHGSRLLLQPGADS